MNRLVRNCLALVLLWGIADEARADSCVRHLPPVEQMTGEDAVCYFAEPMRLHRTLKAAIVANQVSAIASAASAGVSSYRASTVDTTTEWLQAKDDQWTAESNADHAVAMAGSLSDQLTSIEIRILRSPVFARYMRARSVTDSELAWKMLRNDAKQLWNRGERREQREDEAFSARLEREQAARYRRLGYSERKTWNTCPASEPGLPADEARARATASGTFDPMEFIWLRLPKVQSEHACYVQGDVAYLYDNGFVDDLRYELDEWQAALEVYRQDNNTMVLDHDDFLSLRRFRLDGDGNPAARERLAAEVARLRAARGE